MAKEAKLTEGSLRALEILQNATEPLTLAQMNEIAEEPVASAHVTALARRGFVSSEKVEVEVVSTRKVNSYSITPDGAGFEEEAAE